MDKYFRKTRRPIEEPLKRPPPSITPPPITKLRAATPDDARIKRPLKPPPIKKKIKTIIKTKPCERTRVVTPEPLDWSNTVLDGPLKGISTSLLDLVKAKEAAASVKDPEEERRNQLLGIAPEVIRIVSTVFTANKKEVMLYDKVIEKCHKGLKSNYTTETIVDCMNLMDKVAPEWVTTVTISKGKFIRINRGKYTIPQLLEAIRRYERDAGR